MSDFSFKGLIIDYIKANPDKEVDVHWHDSSDPWNRDKLKRELLSNIKTDTICQVYSNSDNIIHVYFTNDYKIYYFTLLLIDILGFINGKINQLIDKEKDNGITFQ